MNNNDIEAKAMLETLKAMDSKVGKAFARKALRAGAKVQQTSAKNNASSVTGSTKAALKIKATKRSTKRVGMLVMISKGDFSNPKFYAPFNELGHKSRHGKHVFGKHWFKNSFSATVAAASAVVRQTLATLINSYKGGSNVSEE